MIYTPLELFRRWKVQCFINGIQYEAEDLPSRTDDIDVLAATATIKLKDIPNFNGDETFVIRISIDGGTTWIPFFNGYVLPKKAGIISREVSGLDILSKVDTTNPTEFTFNNTPYLTAIQTVLEKAGIPSASILISGSDVSDLVARANVATQWTVTVTTEDNLQDVLQMLLDYGRYRLAVDNAGFVRIAKYSTIPTSTASLAFSTSDVQDTEYGIYDMSRELGLSEKLVSKVVVTGSGDAKPKGSWSTNVVTGTITSVQNELCQTVAQCNELAQDIGQDECRSQVLWSISMPTDTEIYVGSVIKIKCPEVGVNDFLTAKVAQRTINGEEMSILVSAYPRAIGGNDDGEGEGGDGLPEDGYDESTLTADFTVEVEQEGNVYGVRVIDTSSSDNGTITAQDWSVGSVGAGYPKPAVADNVKEQFFVVDTTSATITLQVTDSNSNTASVTKALSALGDTEIYIRQLTYVQDGVWYVLAKYPDPFPLDLGGYSPLLVPPYNDTQYIYCVTSDRQLFRYDLEDTATSPTLITTFSNTGTPSCMFQGEIFDNPDSGAQLLVAVGSRLQICNNATDADPDAVDFTTVYDFPATINAVSVNPYNPDQYSVAAGTGLYVSYDRGATFVLEHTATDVIQDFAAFPWSPSIALLTDETVEPAQTTGSFTSTEMTLITPGLTEEKLIVASGSGYFYKVTADAVTQLHAGTTIKNPSRILRDGQFNDIVWIGDYSTFGVGKMVAESEFLSILPATTGCTSLGYGRYLSVAEINIPAPPAPPEPTPTTYESTACRLNGYLVSFSTWLSHAVDFSEAFPPGQATNGRPFPSRGYLDVNTTDGVSYLPFFGTKNFLGYRFRIISLGHASQIVWIAYADGNTNMWDVNLTPYQDVGEYFTIPQTTTALLVGAVNNGYANYKFSIEVLPPV